MFSGSQLQHDVETELKWRPSLGTTQIGVAAKDGIVTLSGQVAHYMDRTGVEDAAKRVYGVKAIAKEITVEVPGSLRRTDADIAAAALNALKWDFQVPEDTVKVIVRDGCVSLEGTVDWQYQKDAADRCVRYLTGVLMFRNLLAIKPRATDSGVRDKIEDASALVKRIVRGARCQAAIQGRTERPRRESPGIEAAPS